MRGLTDIKMIVCDEASFFDESQINETRDIDRAILVKIESYHCVER